MILVLSPEVSEDALKELVATVERLGWSAQVSRGREQTVVALDGARETDRLEAALDAIDGGIEVDVIPVLSAQQYRLKRSRRALLTGLATGLGLMTAAGAGLPVLGFLRPPRGVLGDPEVTSGGSARSLENGMARTVDFRGQPVLLIHLEPGRFVALSALCTYLKACRLDWDRKRRLLACSCHGGTFDVNGNVVSGPSSVPLASYLVERVGDELFVRRS